MIIRSRGNNASLKDTRLIKKQPKSKLRSINHLLGAFSSGNKSTENKNESKDTQKMEKSSKWWKWDGHIQRWETYMMLIICCMAWLCQKITNGRAQYHSYTGIIKNMHLCPSIIFMFNFHRALHASLSFITPRVYSET